VSSDDIIARLRVNAEGAPTKNGGHIWLSLSPSTSAEAADLIEAQHAEIDHLHAELDDLQVLLRGRTAEFQAEIERLRAVLGAVDALARSVDRPDDAVDYWVTGYADAMQKVKALLHPEEARRG